MLNMRFNSSECPRDSKPRDNINGKSRKDELVCEHRSRWQICDRVMQTECNRFDVASRTTHELGRVRLKVR